MRLFALSFALCVGLVSADILTARNETTDIALQQIENQTDLPLPDCAVSRSRAHAYRFADIKLGPLLRPGPARIQLLNRRHIMQLP